MNVKKVIEEFDQYLTKRNLKFEAIITGRAALNIRHDFTPNTRYESWLDSKRRKSFSQNQRRAWLCKIKYV
jgi:hypothetical protein